MSIRIPFTIANGRWRIGTPPEPEAYQLDNNAHKLCVVGDLPEDYVWTMYVSVYGKYKNSIPLTRDDEGASVTLTAENLAYGDTKYHMQLVGVKSGVTRKTNEISVYIPRSLIDGDADWPDTPNVFEEAQEAVLGALTKAPYIDSETSHWMVWDTLQEQFVDTGVKAEGDDGKNYGIVVDGSVDHVLELKSNETMAVPTKTSDLTNDSGFLSVRILKQPEDVYAPVSGRVTMSVEATGMAPLTYQWQRSDDDGATWISSSVAAAVYNTTMTTGRDGRMMRCIVTDGNGDTVTSSPATMHLGVQSLEDSLHYDSLGPMMAVAESYLKVAYSEDETNRIVYRSGCGIFSPAEQITYEGRKAVVCSALVEACLYGIYYQHSRYVQSANERSHWGFVTDGTGTTPEGFVDDYMIAAVLAHYCYDHGWLYEFSTDRPQEIRPGDVLFYIQDGANHWNHIVHCAICVRATKSEYTIVESTSARYTRLVDNQPVGLGICTIDYGDSNYAHRYPAYFTRIPLQAAEYKTELMKSPRGSFTGSFNTATQTLASLTYDNNLPVGIYTARFLAEGTMPSGYVNVSYSGNKSAVYRAEKVGGVIDIIFFAELPITGIDFCLDEKASEDVTATTSYDVSSIRLYKGYQPLEVI